MHRVELSSRAKRDLKRIKGRDRDRLLEVLQEELAAEPQPENLDVRPLAGRAPWLRLRDGDWRVLYRPLTGKELRALKAEQDAGFLVERLVNRRDLKRAAEKL